MAKSFWKNWCADIRMEKGDFDYNSIATNVSGEVAEKLLELSNADNVVDAFTTCVMYMGANHHDLVERAEQYGVQFSTYDRALGALMLGVHPKMDAMIRGCNDNAAWPIQDADGKYIVGVNTDQLRNNGDQARAAVAVMMELIALHNAGKCDLQTGRDLPTEDEMVERIGWLKAKYVGLL